MDQEKQLIERVIGIVLADAERRRMDAACGGHYNDGGASQTEREVSIYRAGIAGRIPAEWQSFHEQARREADPEWGEYLRLAQKFGGPK